MDMKGKEDNWRPGQNYCAHHFEVAFCDDPMCGLHLIAFRSDDSVLCEVVMDAEQTTKLVSICQSFLYDKATKRI
jgi:hypothetical protein